MILEKRDFPPTKRLYKDQIKMLFCKLEKQKIKEQAFLNN